MLRSLLLLLFTGLFMPFAIASTSGGTFDHSEWDQLLHQHVVPLHEGRASVVDYAGLVRDHTTLKSYLTRLSRIEKTSFDQWPRDTQLAFLINAYNAWTVELVLSGYPDIESIKDMGSLFTSPWRKSFIPLFGKSLSLDDIEHGLLRGSGRYNDPRVHFAVNCASLGCPALRAEAYRAETLEVQLAEQTQLFLSDRRRNRFENNTLRVSAIFKWYREDFEQGWKGIASLPAFFIAHAAALGLSSEDIHALQTGQISIEYLDYDWHLNAKRS
ncbi:MAG: DUF547 domain-containing protein [Zetaproteobacteria bacterium CG02_land_8_20_14_3_00_50_9]|nr:MAG: DUF547 domain-containing protein [Zetaproteobacteria bacterium CG17_big_fil_post_rev_8_21_14_2_50_50_13]PIV29247.1 MAG: DUF547 domain-containing protein [Zetaproteobacteria bacterium CG02_land_8_20_14_3_00_50_9]PIY56493.1 MAG: DUF547 domain-containing protein [Zetaproteobacteria bacterium CG_4_10_14_0_8_um_filter_49_80]